MVRAYETDSSNEPNPRLCMGCAVELPEESTTDWCVDCREDIKRSEAEAEAEWYAEDEEEEDDDTECHCHGCSCCDEDDSEECED